MVPPVQTVAEFVDGLRLRGLVRRVPVLCALLMITEGFDLNGIGYAGPLIGKTYHISPQALGVVYSGAVIGSLVGALVVGSLADRIGRRGVLIVSSLLLGLCTAATPFAAGVAPLLMIRLLIGMGFGAAVPSVFAMTADYMPSRLRAMVLNAVTAGVAAGVVMAGLAAAFVIPAFGWKAMMWLSGAGSLTAGLLISLFLPESLSFSLRRRPDHPRSHRLVTRLKHEQGIAPDLVLVAEEAQAPAASPLALITGERVWTTATLFLVLCAAYAVQTFLSYWLPTLLLASGASMTSAGLVSAISKVLSICGGLSIGFAMDRREPWRVLPVVYILAAVVVVALGFSVANVALALILLILSTALVDSSFGGVTALTAMSYPSSIRATGTGWITGLARLIGGGGGTTLGGVLVGAHWPNDRTAFVLSLPLIVGALALITAVRLRDRAPRIGSLQTRISPTRI